VARSRQTGRHPSVNGSSTANPSARASKRIYDFLKPCAKLRMAAEFVQDLESFRRERESTAEAWFMRPILGLLDD
jgi:hypothetical protein